MKGLSDESIKPPATSDDSLSPLIDYLGDKIRLKFNGGCLKQPKLSYTHGETVNIYIAYERWSNTKNADIDKYQYLGYGIEFDRKSSLSFSGGRFGKNVIFFGVDMSFSVHVDNKKRTF